MSWCLSTVDKALLRIETFAGCRHLRSKAKTSNLRYHKRSRGYWPHRKEE